MTNAERIRALHADGMTAAEIVQKTGFSRQAVHQALARVPKYVGCEKHVCKDCGAVWTARRTRKR